MDWQVESGLRTAVFLSATSSDLGECRRQVSDILQEAGVLPVVQDYFGPDPRTIEEMLVDKILAADAVVCLVGHAFGTAPTIDAKPANRSYTQIEYDLALRYEKPLYLFVATEEFSESKPVSEIEALRANQEAHRNAILAGPRKYQLFSSRDQLGSFIHSLVRPILAHSGRRSIKYVHIPPAPACFVGRTDETAQLTSAIERRLPAVIVVLGMGGQGKTTLLANALRSRSTLPFAAGIWVSAERGAFTFTEFLDSALETFMGSRFDKVALPKLEARIRQLISLLQTRPLLIVVDAIERWLMGWSETGSIKGLQDLSLRQGAYEGLDEFLRQASALENGSHLVLSSRALPSALDSVKCAILPVLPKDSPEIGLHPLSPAAAVELLEELGMAAPREKLLEVAESLVFHPLALTGFASVAKRVGANWEALLANRGTDPSHVFHALLDEVRKHLPDRRRSEFVLQCSSLLPEGAALELLETLLKQEIDGESQVSADLLSQILALADWNLLIWDSRAGAVRLHALVAEYFCELIPQPAKFAIHGRAATWYETHADQSEATSARCTAWVLALRHTISAGDSQRALRIMFGNGETAASLFDRLIFNGHLWECVELLASMEEIAAGMDKVQCILARAEILNELEFPHRALADARNAIDILLAQGGTTSLRKTAFLARCHGLQGLIHMATGRATDALPFFHRAVRLFDALITLNGDFQLDLAKTLANRGLAMWGRGDWDGATVDYERILVLLSAPKLRMKIESILMAVEIRSRLAALCLDRGDPSSAVRGLEDAVSELRKARQNSQTRPNKNQLIAMVSLGAAYVANGAPEAALVVLQEVILPLEEMARQGRREFNSVLAPASVNEAQALLLLAKVEDAAQVSDRAVRLYQELVEAGAFQFNGQLGNALFRRSECWIRLGQEENGRNDLHRALAISRDWLRDWFGECNIENVFIDNALHVLTVLPAGFDSEKMEVLEVVSQCLKFLEAAPPQFEATLRAKRILRGNWGSLGAMAAEINVSWPTNFQEN